MQRNNVWWVGMAAAMPLVWAMAGFAALAQPAVTDRASSAVVAQFLAR